jgi:hypothetical protein
MMAGIRTSEHLFSGAAPARLFGSYRRPYPEAFAKEWKQAYEATFGLPFQHHEAFLNAFHYVKEHSPPTVARLNTFIAIYDFARNTAAALLAVGLAASLEAVRLSGGEHLILAALALVAAVLFFLRYLKFFGHYADEVFRAFYILSRSRR